MPPAVAPAPQMRPAALVAARQRRRHLGDPKISEVAFTTISLANSIPVAWRSSARMASRLNPRSPQWKSPNGLLKEQAPEARQERVAKHAVQPGHRPVRDAAANRFPMTRSSPSRNFSTKGPIALKS